MKNGILFGAGWTLSVLVLVSLFLFWGDPDIWDWGKLVFNHEPDECMH